MKIIQDVIQGIVRDCMQSAVKSSHAIGSVIPSNALLNDDGSPILNDDGSYILTGD